MSQSIIQGVDSKRSFGMDSFELSILETVERATIQQTFSEPIFYNLLKGKKIMRLGNDQPFEYLPGNTMIVPPQLEMEVNFPDATLKNPTQCLSLTIDREKIAESLNLLNERHPRLDGKPWHLSMKNYSLLFNEDISQLIFKLYHLAPQHTQEARIIAELTLTELLVLLFQNQNLSDESFSEMDNTGTLAQVIHYIRENLDSSLTIDSLSQQASMSNTSLFRAFKRELNISPIDFINKARVEKAKKIIRNNPDVRMAEIGYAVGFSNPNYFTRIFKQYANLSPTAYKKENTKAS
ncbi:AraC-type DNA-binding protein [Chitinophaga costaii]|uniref:AraC-type DNA-binding protein n=1 Tax=Chitinophaga costaii TaxID=1335309 RepID=A0A1C4G560_9BACT|nr:AraC family transcriptional regulator [Chitinophaga costaii]PUZ22052.1 AraC family transcriptional regulator [Chitinophaga costaii]SCC63093.1 AraC-type DNA-binding protein [Chitinophaga costaii]